MEETELGITTFFNDHLASLGNFFLTLVGRPAQEHPWADYIVMQFVVVGFLMLLFAFLRPRLSVSRPGTLQHVMELLYNFIKDQAETQVGHTAHRYVPFFGTLFIFIFTSNMIGLVPVFVSPTQFPYVPAGCAVATFLYYNAMGLQANGLAYLKHYVGPMWALAPLMIPIEIISNCARMMSLTVRLYANMFAGEQVSLVFLQLTKFVIPVAFLGLHIFVGAIQSYIFMLLTMVYVGSAVAHEH
jgi:F-type H+-transporting ATPase subunit a